MACRLPGAGRMRRLPIATHHPVKARKLLSLKATPVARNGFLQLPLTVEIYRSMSPRRRVQRNTPTPLPSLRSNCGNRCSGEGYKNPDPDSRYRGMEIQCFQPGFRQSHIKTPAAGGLNRTQPQAFTGGRLPCRRPPVILSIWQRLTARRRHLLRIPRVRPPLPHPQ